MAQYYSPFSLFANHTYQTYMSDPSKKASEVSTQLHFILLSYLDQLNIEIDKRFDKKLGRVSKRLLRANRKVKRELVQALPYLKDNITDLNSAVMGIPNDNDSDIDITIAVDNSNDQTRVGKVLVSIGYTLTHIYKENKPAKMKWHTFHKYVDGIEIEVKVRSRRIVDRVLIAHRNIKNNLTPQQKKKISFIKSVLSTGDKKTYKTFKYILYGAMFEGHKKTILFRHENPLK